MGRGEMPVDPEGGQHPGEQRRLGGMYPAQHPVDPWEGGEVRARGPPVLRRLPPKQGLE